MPDSFDSRRFLHSEVKQVPAHRVHAASVTELPKMINLISPINLPNMATTHQAESAMETIAAADAKTNFGLLLDKAQRAPVTISKNGRAVAVLMSAAAYEEQQSLKLELLRREIQKGLDDVKRGKVVSASKAWAAVDKVLRKK
jgi:prevent-host-death family protein